MTTPTLGPPAVDWRQDAACRLVDPELFWPEYGRQAKVPLALHICRKHCPVRDECFAWARDAVDRNLLWPCVAGGMRWVARNDAEQYGGGSGKARTHSTTAKPNRSGCPLCADPAIARGLQPSGKDTA